MHSLELTNIDKSRVYRPAMNAWSNDKQKFRPPDIRPIVPIESGRASLSLDCFPACMLPSSDYTS